MNTNRRTFLFGSLAAASSLHLQAKPATLTQLGYKSPNEKLNIAAIGGGGKGFSDMNGCKSENIVAIADVDWVQGARGFNAFPKAEKFKDFRVMLDKQKDIDAVLVSTPDHTHAVAAMWAMERGKHVYCQKPLTRTVFEARQLALAARKYGVATQMGNQGHSNDGARKLCEMVWSGEIGQVKEVHAWTNRPTWPQGINDPLSAQAVPETMDWDLWLGPVDPRPYNKDYAPFKWRGWYDFGCGALGDMACHILDAANWALLLDAPLSVECIRIEGKNPYTFPTKSVVKFEFGPRGSLGPVTLFWYEGGWKPELPAGLAPDTKLGDLRGGANGSLFIGEKGYITTSTYAEDTRPLFAGPDAEQKSKDYKFPDQVLTRSPGHYRDWIRACKGGERACSNFDYAAKFTEWILLGVIAQRTEGKLEWDAARMRIPNNPNANAFLTPKYRKGWGWKKLS